MSQQIAEPMQPGQSRGCRQCKHLGMDSNDYEWFGNHDSWFECRKGNLGQYLRSFPFHRPQPCFEPAAFMTPCQAMLKFGQQPKPVEEYEVSPEEEIAMWDYALHPNGYDYGVG